MSCLRYGIKTAQSLKIMYLRNRSKIIKSKIQKVIGDVAKFPLSMGNTFWKELYVKAHENAFEKQEIKNSWQHNYVFFRFHKFIITNRTLGDFVVEIPQNTISHVSLIAKHLPVSEAPHWFFIDLNCNCRDQP